MNKVHLFKFFHSGIIYLLLLLVPVSCSIQKKLGNAAREDLLDTKDLANAHIGISVFEPASGKYWFNYQGDHYFVPASNTKIPTCYAAMKFLGDSLVGLRYQKKNDSTFYIQPTGDPTFLHPDFIHQPVYDFFESTRQGRYYFFEWNKIWKASGLGSGWAWSDYMEPYMAERSPFPIYGNLIKFKTGGDPVRANGIYHIPNGPFDPLGGSGKDIEERKFTIIRELGGNRFFFEHNDEKFDSVVLTLTDMSRFYSFKYILASIMNKDDMHFIAGRMMDDGDTALEQNGDWNEIKSQPTDSLLKLMMHRSDNFFAEQSLLMVSNKRLGIMSDERIIDTLLKTEFWELPQKPHWVDGSGLSRYNLFTPQDFVFILNKIKETFGMNRIKNILPTGNTGTLENYYTRDSNYIFAKTGTLSGVLALSGYLYTRKNKLLIFSILVNNHQGSPTAIRKAIEKFIHSIREKY